MTDTSLDELGPVDYVVVEFPDGASSFTGEMAAELMALVDAGTIRVIDALILTKGADGSVDAMELSDVGELGELVGAVRIGRAAFGRPADRQRTNSHPSDHRLDRGGQCNCDRRSLRCQ